MKSINYAVFLLAFGASAQISATANEDDKARNLRGSPTSAFQNFVKQASVLLEGKATETHHDDGDDYVDGDDDHHREADDDEEANKDMFVTVNPGCLSYCERVLLTSRSPPGYCRSICGGNALEAEFATKKKPTTVKEGVTVNPGCLSYCERNLVDQWSPPGYCRSICGGNALEAEFATKKKHPTVKEDATRQCLSSGQPCQDNFYCCSGWCSANAFGTCF